MTSAITLTSEFKTQTTKAIIAIGFFILLYFVLALMALGLTLFCLFGAAVIILAYPSLITIIIGAGLASLGFLILIFLFKFIFASHKLDRSHLAEIKRSDEPALFKLIDDIVKQVNTTFPKKVYLSADVNAAVFYDSNFWSMFLPIRKNLQIGLGLVNSISEEELKSILAHEFGHFSQKTMKVGSYVYNVNQIIFNMLYDNEGYAKLTSRWASMSGFISFFVVIALKIINGIQWILNKMYAVVNKTYLGLSREMEFHADEIAAHVTGPDPLINSLLRLNLASHSYDLALSFYDAKIPENYSSENIFKEHAFIMNLLAADSSMPIENDLPQVSIDELNKFNKSKLVIKNQWASHPSTEERVNRLRGLKLPTPNRENAPANVIFHNIEKTQQEWTQKIFSAVNYSEEPNKLPLSEFQLDFQKQFTNNTFSKLYNGYYDDKKPICFELKKINTEPEDIRFNDLFSQSKVDLIYAGIALESDLEIINQISRKEIPIKTFDYDGKKYTRKESAKLIDAIEKEIKDTHEEIKQNDIKIFKYFKLLEEQINEDLLTHKYIQIFNFESEYHEKHNLVATLYNELAFTGYVTPVEEIIENFTRVKHLETALKKEITDLLDNKIFQEAITTETKANFDLYLSQKWIYFEGESYLNDHLEFFYTTLNNYASLLSRWGFLLKKDLLDYQIALLEKTARSKA